MTGETKDIIEFIISAGQFAVVLGGVIWAIYRFRAERPHNPRVEFDINTEFLGPQDGYYVTQFLISADNKGLRIRKFSNIDLLVRGISNDSSIEEWSGNEPRLLIPDKIIDHAEVVFSKNYGHIFVEPGVKQTISYFARIPENYRFVSVRAEFRYDEERTHSAERIFETPKTEQGSGGNG